MYSINSGDVSYIVPIDHVDLKYLKRSEQIGENLKPLWSPRNEEFTEFQLIAWRASGNEEQLEKNATNTIKCHICDKKVPVVYVQEHNKSKKHKNFLKIADEVLSRLKSSINIDSPTVSSMEPSKSTYFCEACCTSVLTNNKDVHEASEMHKKSTKHDETVEHFLAVLTKDDGANLNGTIDTMANNNSVPTKPNSNAPKQMEQTKEYINTITHKITPDSMEIEVLDENYIVMKLKNSFRVHIDQFHGFVDVRQGVHCLLCNVAVNSKHDHIYTGQHMRWHIWHSVDEQCIRQINQYYAHCIVCNELIRNVDNHKASNSNHTSKVKNALYNKLDNATCHQTQENKKREKTAEKPQENGKVEITGEKGQENEKIEKTTDKQLENVKVEEKQSKPNGENVVMQTGNKETKYNHYLISRMDTFNDVICRLCSRPIPDKKINIIGHLNGKTHKKAYSDFLSTNRMNKVKNGFSCDFCRLHVPDTYELEHVISECHEMNKKEDIKFTTHQTYCEPCMVYIDTHNLEQHRKGQNHKRRERRQTNNNDITKNVVTTNSVIQSLETIQTLGQEKNKQSAVTEKSKIIQTVNEDIEPSNNAINLKTPTEIKNIQPSTSGINKDRSTSEIKNIQTLMSALDIKSSTSEKKTDVKNFNIQPLQTKIAEQKVKSKIHHHLKETAIPMQLLCKVCNVPVPNTSDNITSHTNGYNHKSNYNNLLKINKVVQIESNFHCNKCNVPITNKNEIDHILGNRHKNAFSDDDSIPTRSDTKNKDKQTSSADQDMEYKAKLYLFDQTLVPQEVSCKVCHINVCDTPDNMIKHTKEASHLAKYNNILIMHKIVALKDGFFCQICNESIASQKELGHTYTHQLSLLKTESKDDGPSTVKQIYCGFCHTHVPEKDYLDHKISLDHSKCVKNISKSSFIVCYFNRIKKSFLKCKLCNCTEINDYDYAIKHLEGSSHIAAYTKLLDVNKICKVGEKTYCLACKEIIRSQEELLHIWEPNHSGNLSLIK